MYSKRNKKTNKQDFHVGAFKKECKKVKALWNRATRKNGLLENQMDTTTSRRICAPIPLNQEKIAAKARGEEPEHSYFNSLYMVRVI